MKITVDSEFRSLIPPLTPEEYEGLEASILADGCRDALVVWPVRSNANPEDWDDPDPYMLTEYILIDGHNRYEICTSHNIPYKTVEMEFASRDEAMLWMIDAQFSRRNLEAPDRILLAQKKAPIIERMARAKQFSTLKQNSSPRVVQMDKTESVEEIWLDETEDGGDRKSEECKGTAVVQMDKSDLQNNEHKSEQPKPIHVRDEVAKMAGVSSGTLARFEQVQKKKPELIENMRRGEMSINEAYNTVRKEERAQNIQAQVEEIERGNIEKPDGLFDVIAIDPPWNYGTKFDSSGRRVANPYPEMSQDELLELEIPAKDNCVMFLWTTQKFIWDAKSLLDAWGFEYRAMLVWDKDKIGMGDFIRMQCEFCLIGIKGKPVFRDNHGIRDIIREPRREHSRKPDAFYELVDSLCVGRKLDFFSRESREGWESYGNDTEKF